MSMNLHVWGTRDVTVNKTGEQSVQVVHFDLWQTPTTVTRKILESDNYLQAYIDWVNEDRIEHQEPVYSEDDLFGEGEIIGYKTVCYADYHINELKEFIAKSEKNGYDIEFFTV